MNVECYLSECSHLKISVLASGFCKVFEILSLVSQDMLNAAKRSHEMLSCVAKGNLPIHSDNCSDLSSLPWNKHGSSYSPKSQDKILLKHAGMQLIDRFNAVTWNALHEGYAQLAL